MLFWGRGSDAPAVERLHRNWEGRHLVNACSILGSQTTFESLLPAADMALVTAPERLAVTPVLACMTAQIPLIAPGTYAVTELLEDHHTALLYREVRPRLIAQRTLMMWEQPALRRQLTDQARAAAYQHFSATTFADAMRRIYLSDPPETDSHPRQDAALPQPA